MMTILEKIVAEKINEVAVLRSQKLREKRRSDLKRPFLNTIKNSSSSLAIIAEVKKASPSKGIIKSSFDPVKIADSYQNGGASAISVLTDEKFFMGSESYLSAIRKSVDLPLLRKDFIIDTVQVEQTAAMNADAMLLIAAILENKQMADLYQAAKELDLDPLVEIHSLKELDRVMKYVEPELIGINNRNLSTFVTDIEVSLEIIKQIPSEIAVVAESGIKNGEQAKLLRDAGFKALLVGESLMRQVDPSELIRELSCRPKS